jgi:peptidoglycan LD-endopeptidase CwlK
MTPRSEQTLAPLEPAFADAVRRAQATLEPSGIFLCVYSGLRTAEEQNNDFAKGRTLPGAIVTNAKAGYSMHNYGLAADIVPYLQGKDGALDWNSSSPRFMAMVVALKSEGLAWGGDWVHFKDMDHFQSNEVPVSPSTAMMVDYHVSNGQLGTIWEKATTGAYK